MLKTAKICILLVLPAVLSLTSAVRAEQLDVAVSVTLPPFVFPEKDSGIDLEIAREALELAGYEFMPVYASFGRVPRLLENEHVDGALTVNESQGLEGVFLSRPYICYQNAVVSLAGQGPLEGLEDLEEMSVAAFQDAAKILGPRFALAVAESPNYREVSNQENQVAMLYMGRVQAIVLDRTIFDWYRTHSPKADPDADVVVGTFFPPSCYSAAFRNRTIRDEFNRGVAELMRSGRYKEIFANHGVNTFTPPTWAR